jgi:subtilisin-like proprotein convertase family protein
MRSAFIFGCLTAAAVSHGAELILSSGALNAPIPDANVSGLQSTLVQAPFGGGSITNVELTLNISGGYNGDLYAYIAHSTGFSVLLNRVGRTGADPFGYSDAGFSVTFKDSAPDIHNYGGNGGLSLSGNFSPDARNVDPATVTLLSPQSAYLSSFNDLSPDGNWTLFIADMSAGEQSTLLSWQLKLDVVPIPEPSHIALGFSGLIALFLHRWAIGRRRKP